MKIGMGSAMEENFGEMEENTRGGESGGRGRRWWYVCRLWWGIISFSFNSMVGERIEMGACSLLLVCSEEEVGQGGNNTISGLTKKGEGGFLIIEGYPVDEL